MTAYYAEYSNVPSYDGGEILSRVKDCLLTVGWTMHDDRYIEDDYYVFTSKSIYHLRVIR